MRNSLHSDAMRFTRLAGKSWVVFLTAMGVAHTAPGTFDLDATTSGLLTMLSQTSFALAILASSSAVGVTLFRRASIQYR